MSITIEVNGERETVDVAPDTPLLWTLRDVIGLTGTKFGCGIAQCGACTVQIDGEPVRSCLLPVGSIGDRKVTTIEEIGATEAGRKIQKAWLDLEVPQLLPVRPDHVRRRFARQHSRPQGFRHRRSNGRKHLPVRHICAHPRRDQTSRPVGLREARP
jgi:xanthine dehydrogenase iron-sulfur cluster and FAD-binding subunit A